jgi:glycosyltransferase involved in cell wall biosynthesis
MRILLTATASYVPPRGGATRSNLAWLEQLTAAGHECRVVGGRVPNPQPEIEEQQIRSTVIGINVVEREGIAVYSAPDPARQAALLREQVAEFQPDWVVVSSEDAGHILLREAHQDAPGKVVYLAHTPQFFPFGPESWNPDPHGAELVRRSTLVVVIGTHMAGYVREHAGCEPEVIHPPIYGSGPFPDLHHFETGLITMINPCAVKGIDIFLALADGLPEYPFGALPGWATTRSDAGALQARRNITMLPGCREIGEFLARTRVLLMPSLWYEGFGLIVMEAMLRGIPVIASDSGGLVEAKAGTGFVVPVRPIEGYDLVFDERGMPRPVTPEQDVKPWADALRGLLSDRDTYERESARSRQVALAFVERLRPGQLEQTLLGLRPRAESSQPDVHGTAAPAVEKLSPERRALLLQLLRKQGTRSSG